MAHVQNDRDYVRMYYPLALLDMSSSPVMGKLAKQFSWERSRRSPSL